jgi:hypothetical protein
MTCHFHNGKTGKVSHLYFGIKSNHVYYNNNRRVLKGQCHEMVVEIRQWSGTLCQTLGCEPFFPFKNRPSQRYGPYSSASNDVKTGSPDPANFATTRPPIHCQVLAICAMFERPLAYRSVTAGSGRIICQNLPAVAYRAYQAPWQIAL